MWRVRAENLFSQNHRQKNIVLNDNVVTKNGIKVKPGDRLLVNVPKAVEPNIEAENIPLDILFEDDDILIVNKPKGMVVHPSAGL